MKKAGGNSTHASSSLCMLLYCFQYAMCISNFFQGTRADKSVTMAQEKSHGRQRQRQTKRDCIWFNIQKKKKKKSALLHFLGICFSKGIYHHYYIANFLGSGNNLNSKAEMKCLTSKWMNTNRKLRIAN